MAGLPLPRRFVVLFGTILSLLVIYHFLAPSYAPLSRSSRLASYGSDSISGSEDEADGYLSPSSWLPWQSSETFDKPLEFDEDGQCLFLSAYNALSREEKQRAEWMELEEVSAGVVRSKFASDGEGDEVGEGTVQEYDGFEDPDMVHNATRKRIKFKGQSHPILKLLKQGEDKWNERINGQSKTLEEAVEKYVSKWGRQPPKGFDRWWQFAMSVNVLLPDDHDAIMNALLPFYGLPIPTLAERAAEAEKIVETFTLIVENGQVVLQWNDNYSRDTWWASRPRADSQINLMEPFLSMLPDFRATFTIHDQPSILLDYQRHRELVDAARQGKVSNHKNEADRYEQVWSRACAKDSPLVRGDVELPETDTFIERHTAAMDICQHPSYMDNHGMLLEEHDANMHPKPHTKLFPLFVPSKTMLNGDIPVTPIGRDGRRDDVGHDPEWSKKSGKLYWRGLATGLNHNKKGGSKWRQSHRERLHFLANDKTSANQEILSPIGNTGAVEYARYPMSELGDYYMDVKLAGGHWQCDGEDGTCDEMNNEIDWAEKDPGERSNEFKYVFDTDGNAWSSRFPRLMASNNVVVKASVFPEWNTQSLPEWYAYVPSKMDYSDLYSIMAFFRGTPSGKGGHDEVARRIALNSQCWVERTWRREDMQSYMFLLYLEYARLVSPDRDNGKMDFHLRKSSTPSHHSSGTSTSTSTGSTANSNTNTKSNGQTHAEDDISADIAEKEISEGLKITLKDAHSPAGKVAVAVAEKEKEVEKR